MITGEIKNKVDQLWTTFWTGGLTNPLDVVEQMTYLMFIHDLDEFDAARKKEAAMLGIPYKSLFGGSVEFRGKTLSASALKWSEFRDFEESDMFAFVGECVFPFIKNLDAANKESAFSTYMADAIFKIPTPKLLAKIVGDMDSVYAAMPKERDAWGDLYEYLLSKIATAGVNGQFRTPRHIIDMMVELVEPTPDDVICDPAFGTAGFLVAAGNYLKSKRKDDVLYNKKNKEHFKTLIRFGVAICLARKKGDLKKASLLCAAREAYKLSRKNKRKTISR